MRWRASYIGVLVLATGLPVTFVQAQPQEPGQAQPTQTAPTAAPQPDLGSAILNWTPEAFSALSSQATEKSSFTMDHTMLTAAAGMMSDADAQARQAINKLTGLSVHMLHFTPAGVPDEMAVDSIRAAYHLRGWKHLVTTTSSGGPVHNGSTDVWVVMDGVNLKGAVVLAETSRSLTLAAVTGNLSPVDLLHLRGHFGIPRFEGDNLHSMK